MQRAQLIFFRATFLVNVKDSKKRDGTHGDNEKIDGVHISELKV